MLSRKIHQLIFFKNLKEKQQYMSHNSQRNKGISTLHNSMVPNLGLFPSFVLAKETLQNSSNDSNIKPFIWILHSSSPVLSQSKMP